MKSDAISGFCLDTEKKQEDTALLLLLSLLARIHRDGGHYTAKHGLEKSVEDADALVAQWIVEGFNMGHPMENDVAEERADHTRQAVERAMEEMRDLVRSWEMLDTAAASGSALAIVVATAQRALDAEWERDQLKADRDAEVAGILNLRRTYGARDDETLRAFVQRVVRERDEARAALAGVHAMSDEGREAIERVQIRINDYERPGYPEKLEHIADLRTLVGLSRRTLDAERERDEDAAAARAMLDAHGVGRAEEFRDAIDRAERAERDLAEARAALAGVREAGTRLANLAYNAAQSVNVSEQWQRCFDTGRREWDAVVAGLTTTGGEREGDRDPGPPPPPGVTWPHVVDVLRDAGLVTTGERPLPPLIPCPACSAAKSLEMTRCRVCEGRGVVPDLRTPPAESTERDAPTNHRGPAAERK